MYSEKVLPDNFFHMEKNGFSFSKKYRLLKHSEFKAVQSAKNRLVTPNLVFLFRKNSLGYIRIGLTVSKKHGNSVQRNRIKRIIRVATRLSMPRIRSLSFDVVILPKKNTIHCFSRDLLTDLNVFLQKTGY